ncbi:LacI family DNA-binding transcriptional regulator [Propionibacterium sp. oral taxon 192]|uniref:LacI family DNA-binding transcriptional regulator n=1 Tax=Propionibacterium sp. oral taxon 192 TaxID=671222 RepID=UPI001E5BFA56|nr:LacI family DNA-binding transcriptional regulator [Propionibacterium sp. oral taxon 192]
MSISDRPTMTDVAARAKVSLKTVSRVVNGEPGVAAATIETVEKAVAELGYRADLQARGLRRGDRRSQSVGLIVSAIANPFDAEIHGAVEAFAGERDIVVLGLSSGGDPDIELRRATSLFERQIDGLIISCAGPDQQPLIDLAEKRPVVFIDREPSVPLGDAVVTDNQMGAVRATRHLVTAGHRRIALLADDQRIQTARLRCEGFLAAMDEFGIGPDAELIRCDLLNEEMAHAATHELLSSPNPPTAIFAAQNALTIGALRAIHQLGLEGRVGLVSFDDIPHGDMFPVGLTAITQDPTRIGQVAIERLLGRIDGSITTPPERIVVPTGFVVRGSGEIPPPNGE